MVVTAAQRAAAEQRQWSAAQDPTQQVRLVAGPGRRLEIAWNITGHFENLFHRKGDTLSSKRSGPDAVNEFITECIDVSSSDLFAARVFKFSTAEKSKNQVLRSFQHIRADAIQDAFTRRMAARYSSGSALTPTRWDIYAFSVWAEISETEREKETSFWERFIGQSRAKLAEAFDLMAPAGAFWTKDSPAFIDRLIPIETLRRMYSDIPPGSPLDAAHEKALERLKRFLDGNFMDGELLDQERSLDQLV